LPVDCFSTAVGQAAGTIHGRFQGLYGGRTPLPAELASTSDEHLARSDCPAKSAYLKDLGSRVALGELPIETLHELSDEEIISALTGKGHRSVDGADVPDVQAWQARCPARSGPRSPEGNSEGVPFA
jgi:hypothetical protein